MEWRFQPIPLHDRSLEHRGGRIGVVFQQLRRAPAVITQVEAAVEVLLASFPAPLDGSPGKLRDAQVRVGGIACPHHPIDQFERHLLELAGRRLEFVDLGGGEDVAGGLVPVGSVIDGVEDEAEVALDVLAPIPARRDRQPAQGSAARGGAVG